MAVYVFDDAKNLFEGMTKEQIVNAIAAATGLTPAEIDADVITTAIKEQNAQKSVNLWIGTQNEYNAIQQPDESTLYVVTDPDETNQLQNEIELLQARIDDLEAARAGEVIFNGSAAAGQTLQTTKPLSDYAKIAVDFVTYGIKISCVKTNGTKSPLYMSNKPVYLGSVYDPFDGILYCVKLRVDTNIDDKSVYVLGAQAISDPFTDQEQVDNCAVATICGFV